ncbi:MAG: hypothetical protein K0R34_742 [Herbinix sp.]|jgi:hypothetical protein|nr:hypothetical protein [Herbinix sp.]
MKIKKEQLGLALLIIFLLLAFQSTSFIGTTAGNLEKDARKSQQINATWDVSRSVNQYIGAMIFYNTTRDNFIFSIYLNHTGFSLGYFFASGGATSGIDNHVKEFEFDQYGSVLISMNTKKIAKIELDNGIEITTIHLDSTKPFAEVIPSNCGKITLYDIKGNEVPLSSEN